MAKELKAAPIENEIDQLTIKKSTMEQSINLSDNSTLIEFATCVSKLTKSRRDNVWKHNVRVNDEVTDETELHCQVHELLLFLLIIYGQTLYPKEEESHLINKLKPTVNSDSFNDLKSFITTSFYPIKRHSFVNDDSYISDMISKYAKSKLVLIDTPKLLNGITQLNSVLYQESAQESDFPDIVHNTKSEHPNHSYLYDDHHNHTIHHKVYRSNPTYPASPMHTEYSVRANYAPHLSRETSLNHTLLDQYSNMVSVHHNNHNNNQNNHNYYPSYAAIGRPYRDSLLPPPHAIASIMNHSRTASATGGGEVHMHDGEFFEYLLETKIEEKIQKCIAVKFKEIEDKLAELSNEIKYIKYGSPNNGSSKKSRKHKKKSHVKYPDTTVKTTNSDSAIVRQNNIKIGKISKHKSSDYLDNKEHKKDSGLLKELSAIKEQMKALKNSLKSNSGSNSNNHQKKEELKSWLKHECHLEEYYNVFIENGLEEMNVIAQLSINDLAIIGVKKLGHRVKIMQCIQKLRYEQQSDGTHHKNKKKYISLQ